MFFYEGLSCPHCHKAFCETDDIVACPVCGAPHHRGCWGDAGGCACREDHGTEREWTRDKAFADAKAAEVARQNEQQHHTAPSHNDYTVCPRCGANNSPYAEMCYHCGGALNATDWHSTRTTQAPPPPSSFNEYAPFHTQASPCGGVDPDTTIEEVKASDLAAIVRSNSAYYVPRFQHLSGGNKVSWNWAAFLLTAHWLLYRKQYLLGALALAFDVLMTAMVNVVMYTELKAVMVENAFGQMTFDVYKWMELCMENERVMLATMLITMLGVCTVLYHVLLGLFGTRLYMKDCIRKIQNARQTYPEGYTAQLSVVGGTSFVLGALSILAINTFPSIILSIFLL